MNLIAMIPEGITELTVNGLTQWDYGRKLELHGDDLPSVVEVHFSCPSMQDAIVKVGSSVGGPVIVSIPDQCLEQSAPITAWVYEIGENSGATVKTITLNIQARKRPQAAESVDPENADKYTEFVTAINETLEGLRTGEVKAKSAEYADSAGVATNAITAAAASTATNVTGKINGVDISRIFELDGVSAKQATSAFKASSINQNFINSATDLETLAHNLETGGVSFKKNITIGSVEIPQHSKGVIMSSDVNASLIVTDADGNIYSVSRDSDGFWTKAQVIKVKPDSAEKADTATSATTARYLDWEGVKFGRNLVKRFTGNGYQLVPNVLTELELGSGASGLLVVEVAVRDATGGDIIMKFRTNPFTAKQVKADGSVRGIHTHTVDALTRLVCYTYGSALFARWATEESNPNKNNYYITAVYKEYSE